jgi:hypothetical protein
MADETLTKSCSACKKDLPLGEFCRDRSTRTGLNGKCRACQYQHKLRWLANPNNAAKQRKWKIESYQRASAATAIARQQQRIENESVRATRSRLSKLIASIDGMIRRIEMRCGCGCAVTRKGRVCELCKRRTHRKQKDAWRKRNPDKWREYSRGNRARRYRGDAKYHLSQRIRSNLRSRVKNRWGKRAVMWLPFTIEQLEKRLRSTMPAGYTWQDFMSGALHIDHVLPVDAFEYERPTDPGFIACWALSNLQLLPAADNLRKGNRICLVA